MLREGVVIACDGSTVPVQADTICVHGDTPGAGMIAARLRTGLEEAGIRVVALQAE
jgi:5-oxoprolinase (ATP-hydrolysing) subunit A